MEETKTTPPAAPEPTPILTVCTKPDPKPDADAHSAVELRGELGAVCTNCGVQGARAA